HPCGEGTPSLNGPSDAVLSSLRLAASSFTIFFALPAPEGSLDLLRQYRWIDRLFQKIKSAKLYRCNPFRCLAISGHDNDRQREFSLVNPGEQHDAVTVRQAHMRQDNVVCRTG